MGWSRYSKTLPDGRPRCQRIVTDGRWSDQCSEPASDQDERGEPICKRHIAGRKGAATRRQRNAEQKAVALADWEASQAVTVQFLADLLAQSPSLAFTVEYGPTLTCTEWRKDVRACVTLADGTRIVLEAQRVPTPRSVARAEETE